MMEDDKAAGPAHVRTTELRCGGQCAPWWSAFFHARADVAHVVEQPPSCRDYTRVERSCDVEHDVRTGRNILHCRETREQFRICSESRVDRLATTSIETREPLLEGHTIMSGRNLESVQQPADANQAHPSGSESAQRGPSSASGRFPRPFRAFADDGRSAGPATIRSGGTAVLTPDVGQAVEDIMLFADEMQRDLANHGLLLLRRGEEEQRPRKPGLMARLFGARGWDDTRFEGIPGNYSGPHSA
ncbi:hypothetical protein Vretimale_5434 [Volvox reticuliferus]|uniref:Uncharacterized protein n=1 Tax=Volvox reticuliferus TaxID=1737510 RepID=A0A8J4G597_9CHLO|nr:hypothetical protein Vretifemale_3822 [Volvox reticuliferus]GIM00285.1 hypothetical protein Vretimale_5434 [Volvox reticuliferus]